VAEYHVENFGCRANRADGESIDAELSHGGLTRACGAAAADVVVVNTCSVTAQAERTARAFLRRVRRQNPAASIVVTGCYAQRAPREVAALEGVQTVIGNSHKALAADLVLRDLALRRVQGCQVQGSAQPLAGFVPVAALTARALTACTGDALPPHAAAYVDPLFAHTLAMGEPRSSLTGRARGQTRPNLKVQDGCGNRCSFCVIPETRGPSRSLSLEACLAQVEAFVVDGGMELVLSGINLGRWGRDLTPRRTLEELVSAILATTQLARIRVSSIEPMDWTPPLLALFREHAHSSDPRLARHAHLPLQSGSDAILRAMHRRYRPWHYAEKLRAIRESMPDAAIGADVMVGFPGESEALFEESFAFIAAQPFTYLHLFPFSARPGTSAWRLDQSDPAPQRQVRVRMDRLRRLIEQKNLAFRQSFLGRELPAVTLETPESERRQGITHALTDNFLKLRVMEKFSPDQIPSSLPANRRVRAIIQSISGDGLIGCLLT
jgi:threonylcarbamoyladenosine tRNA methylthiotransferase MtaB